MTEFLRIHQSSSAIEIPDCKVNHRMTEKIFHNRSRTLSNRKEKRWPSFAVLSIDVYTRIRQE